MILFLIFKINYVEVLKINNYISFYIELKKSYYYVE